MSNNAVAVPTLEPRVRVGLLASAVTILAILTVVGFGLRVWKLDAKSLWWDETLTLFLSGRPPAATLALLRNNDWHPPLHYLLVHAVTSAWPTEAGVRFPSVIAGTLAVSATYLLGRSLLGGRAGLIAGTLVAISPAHVMASQEGRMYALMSLWVVLSWGALWMATSRDHRWWIAYSFVTALGFYTHYVSFVILVVQGLYIVVNRPALHAFRWWVLATAVACLLFAPWLPALVTQFAQGGNRLGGSPALTLRAVGDVGALWQFGGGVFQTESYAPRADQHLALVYYPALLLPLLLVLIAALGRPSTSARPTQQFVFWAVVAPVLLVILINPIANVFKLSDVVVLVPLVALAAAAGVDTLAEVWQRIARQGSWMLGLLLLWLALFAATGLQTYYSASSWDGIDWRVGIRFVDSRAGPTDTLALIPGMIGIPLRVYGHHPRPTMVADPATWLDPARAGERDQERRRLSAAVIQHDLWLLSVRSVADPLVNALAKDVQGLIVPRERWGFGDFVVVHFTHGTTK